MAEKRIPEDPGVLRAGNGAASLSRCLPDRCGQSEQVPRPEVGSAACVRAGRQSGRRGQGGAEATGAWALTGPVGLPCRAAVPLGGSPMGRLELECGCQEPGQAILLLPGDHRYIWVLWERDCRAGVSGHGGPLAKVTAQQPRLGGRGQVG